MALISEQPLEDYNSPEKDKQMTESVEKLLASKEDMPISQTNLNIEGSQKEVPVFDDHFTEDPIPEIESVIEEIEDKSNREVRPASPEPVYFISRDPDPKIIAPVGGSGPTLTKTIVKPQAEQPKADAESEPPAIEPPVGKKQEEIDEEELRKLEEEVEQLKKEAEANLINQGVESPGDISIIDEQTIFVDGKLKKKKKKKKKRKKIGGGEETIANITIDEEDIQQLEEPKDIKLNPVQKKKNKSKKNIPNTELNTVEEDSKEDLAIADIKNLPVVDSQAEKDPVEEQKATPLQSIKEQSVKEQDENDWQFLEVDPLPITKDEGKSAPVQEPISIDPLPDFAVQLKEEPKKTKKLVDIPDEPIKPQQSIEPKYLKQSRENKNKLEEELEQRRIFGDHVSPEKTETHEKSTEDQSIIPAGLPSRKLSEKTKTK